MYINLQLLSIKGKTTQYYSMHSENFKADFLKMASTIHATFRNTSHAHFLEQKCDLSIKISSKTCRFETCRYLKLPSFKLILISWEWVTYALYPICQKFCERYLWSSSNVHLIDDGTLSSFQEIFIAQNVCLLFSLYSLDTFWSNLKTFLFSTTDLPSFPTQAAICPASSLFVICLSCP